MMELLILLLSLCLQSQAAHIVPDREAPSQAAGQLSYRGRLSDASQADDIKLYQDVDDMMEVLGLNKDSVRSQSKDCTKHCPYGMETDIEGRQLCKCRDPCKGVKCFGGSNCQPEKQCELDRCSYVAVCKAEDVCQLAKPKHTFMCDKLSKRYYYNQKKGRCRKFWGCADISGNSFDTKKQCKRSCYSKEDRRRERKRTEDSNRISESIEELAEISNHIPMVDSRERFQYKPFSGNRILEYPASKDISNHVESHVDPIYKQPPVTGLDPLSGCPEDAGYVECPFDPCAGCSNPEILCFTSFCGQCQAIYINLVTGQASDQFAAIC